MSEFKLIKSSHCVGESNYHLLFIPKYRKPIFEDERIKKEFFRLCAEIARDKGLVLVAVNAGTDHAHVFVSNCRRYSAPVLAQLFKGITSRMLRKHPVVGPLLQKYVWKEGTLWSSGYFYRSIGSTTNQAMEYYIRYAQRKHWIITKEREYRAQKLIIEFVEQPDKAN